MHKTMDHASYQRKVKGQTDAALRFTIKDAQQAIEANPSNPNNGYYADEICYACTELHKRGGK